MGGLERMTETERPERVTEKAAKTETKSDKETKWMKTKKETENEPAQTRTNQTRTNQPAILLKFHMKYLWLKRCNAKEEMQWKCTLVMTTTPNGLLNNVARLFLCRQRIFSVNKHLSWIIFNAKCQNLETKIKRNEEHSEKNEKSLHLFCLVVFENLN